MGQLQGIPTPTSSVTAATIHPPVPRLPPDSPASLATILHPPATEAAADSHEPYEPVDAWTVLQHAAEEHGDRIAVVDCAPEYGVEGRLLTYRQLYWWVPAALLIPQLTAFCEKLSP